MNKQKVKRIKSVVYRATLRKHNKTFLDSLQESLHIANPSWVAAMPVQGEPKLFMFSKTNDPAVIEIAPFVPCTRGLTPIFL